MVLIIVLVKKLCDFQAKALITRILKKSQKYDKNQMQLSSF